MMKNVDKKVKVVIVSGDDQQAVAERLEEKHSVTVLTPHDVGEEYEEAPGTPLADREVNAVSSAELGAENFVLQTVEELPDGTVAVLYALEPADVELLKAQYDDDLIEVSGDSADQAVADFLES